MAAVIGAVHSSLTTSAQTFIASDGLAVNSCSGIFYDSGGPSGNYADNEDQTVTICPDGGAGSGPFTSVTFLTFNVQLLALTDQLVIHDGPSTASPVLATGNFLTNLTGQSFTATGASGCLTFHWTSDLALNFAGWSAAITTGPSAGTNGSFTACSTMAPFNLFPLLGATPDGGGSWTAPGGGPHGATFDPQNDPAGVYTYTVSGPAPCADSSATVTITLIDPASPGNSSALAVCANGTSVNLFAALGGAPAPGGSWTGPLGPHSGTFNPASDPSGVYTYTVIGPAPCGSSSASVTITVNQPADAGTNGTITVCENDAPFSLFAELGGTPDAGGAWTGPGGSPVPATYTPGTSVPGVYTYTVLGVPPCATDNATVTVTQITAPDAGIDNTITVCSDDGTFALISQLNGTPDPGGTWTGPGGPQGPNFNPAVGVSGNYIYTVAGTPPCANATATVNITVRQAPDAGTNGTVTVCSTDGSFALFTRLGGTPDVGGTWTAPGGGAHSGTFVPGTSTAGVYTYTVTGQSPCSPDVATVTVTVNTAPNAGTGGSVVRCSNDPSFSLFSQLGGTPNGGGTWTGPGGPHGATFNPATDTPGAYTYTVPGLAPCANATAVLNVSVVTAPDAGGNGSTTVCSNGSSFALINFLAGTPDGNGTWTGPGGASNGTFVPGVSAPGTYTYTVPGQSPCANDQATVQVGVVQAPNAGTNGSVTVCSDDGPVNLFALLGGSPSPGGTWTRPNGTAHNGTYQPGSEVGGTYTYTVAGTPPCANATASVLVDRVIAPNAGTNGNITVCSTNSSFALIGLLGGNPSGSGTWRNPSNGAHSGTFVPGTSTPGTYAYIVPGTAPCVNDTGFVTVNVNIAPNAGTNGAISVCSSDSPFPLFAQLGGTPNAGGSWTGPSGSPHSGTYTPGMSEPGGYTYTVDGTTPCLDASAVVVVSQSEQPDAGNDAAFTRCSTDGPVDMFTLLGGTCDPGGTWTGPSGASSGIFLPGTSTPGEYTYVVMGSPPCENDSSTVIATVNPAPDAGSDGDITVCADTDEVDLMTGLGGTPDGTGTWNDDDNTGQLSGNIFSPTGLPPGDYDFTYTVDGIGQCGDAEATVRVTIVAGLNAGNNGNLSVCNTNATVNLFSGLTGAPQPGGVWIELSGTSAVSGQTLNATLVPPGSYQFRYLLNGTPSCDADSAVVTVNVVAAPNAGTNGSVTACSNGSSFNLFTALGGDPQGGGIWRCGPTVVSNMYNPPTHTPCAFTYTVNGSGPCPNAVSTVTVSEVPAPDAGGDDNITVCSNGGPFNMTQELNGNPQVGVWTFSGQPHSAIFDPSTDAQGIYVYTVAGTFPCNPDQSSLTITVEQAANAGTNADTTVCSDDNTFLLFSLLGGGAQPGGTWTDPFTAPHNGIYDPGVSEPGDYTYTVDGDDPCTPDISIVTVFENEAPDAGNSSATTLCTGGPNVNLFTVLGGSPDPGGNWVGPAPGNPPFNGIFIPGTSIPGIYTYRLPAAAPCAPDSSTVTVGVEEGADAGCPAVITICSSQSPFAMTSMLGCSPALNGIWTGPAPSTATMDGVFFPGTTAPGQYTYTVESDPPCPDATSTLTINVNTAPNAGNNAGLTVCENQGLQNLFLLLGPNAQTGGSWIGPNGPHSGQLLPSIDDPGNYEYTVTGLAPCTSDSAIVTVAINAEPEAGSNGLLSVCSEDDPFLLIDVLNGNPAPNGSWTGPAPSTASHNGIFLPGTNQGGVYTYTVAGMAPCANATAQATIIQNEATDAGEPGSITVCSDQPQFDLFDELNGTPDEGGDWIGPSGPSTGIYDPGSSQPGVYWYHISGDAPCENDSASVTVTENTAADAGISTVALICSDTTVFPLIDLLGGTPDPDGSWTYNGDPHGPDFDPATDSSGAYVYTVDGDFPCADVTAQVQITEVNAPDAGGDGDIAACVDDPSISLALGLEGTYDPGGTWSDDDGTGQLAGSTFNASGLPAGAYHFTYTVPGSGPCASSSATVTVNVNDDLYAGEDTTASVCQSELFCLSDLLTAGAQAGGFWIDYDGSGALVGVCVFDASAVPEGSTWHFDYILAASGLCEGDTARLTLTVLDGPNAGCNGFMNVCAVSGAPNVQLASVLGCNPDVNGSWFGPDLFTPHPPFIDPDVDQAGVYYYVVPGVGSCPSDTSEVQVNVTEPPDAGSNTTLQICSTDVPVDMFSLLGPNADPGGAWFYVTGGTQHNGIYNPAIDLPGTYRYTVQGTFPCSPDFALVTVTEPQFPNAGCDAALSVCSDQAPILMRNFLGCSPAANGTWTFNGDPHGPNFDPASDEPGVYTYTVAGIAPCDSAIAQLAIAVTTAADAGEDAVVNICLDAQTFSVFLELGPDAQAGGTWTDVDGSGALSGDLFSPSVAGNGTWHFLYNLPSNGPCTGDESTVTVNVGAGSSAGEDSSVTVCGADTAYVLFDALGGAPETGGVWSDTNGSGALLPDGILDASLLPIGGSTPFTYTITDPGCGQAFATVMVTAAAYPVAGRGAELVMCSTADPFDLFSVLTGNPQTGGTWTGPGGPHSSTFDPAVDGSGDYVYVVDGGEYCPDATAVIEITVNDPPEAGNDGTILTCDTVTALDLFAVLQGTPQTGGTWVDLDGAGGLTGGILNTTVVEPGNYDFSYTVNVPGCGSASAIAKVEVVTGVEVIDVVRTCNTTDRTYVVTFVIQQGDPGTYQVTGLDGTISTGPVYTFTSAPIFTSQTFEAFVQDQYGCTIVPVQGGTPCDFENEVFVPETFSPNGDGVNDAFLIPGIEGFPNNTLVIFNRWGAEIYDGAGYDNSTVVWDGTSPNAALAGPAPAGTYFYILDLGDGSEALTGYVYLNR